MRPPRTRSGTARSSGTCSRAGSTSRRRSSRRCSSRSPTAGRRSSGPGRRSPISSTLDVWGTVAAEAAGESPLWAEALRPEEQRELLPVFSPLAEARFALGLETIYEAYLLHYGRPRLFAPPDGDVAVLLGDYLYAHGLARIAALGDVGAVSDLAELVSLCAQLRADRAGGDGAAWAATAAVLGRGGLEEARDSLRLDRDASRLLELARSSAGEDAVARALELHAGRVG
jgi:hypothetical protein